MYIEGSTLRYNQEKGLYETYWIICPVCWSTGVKITKWEDGREEFEDCINCLRYIKQTKNTKEEGKCNDIT